MFNREFVRFIRTTRDEEKYDIGSNELFFDNWAHIEHRNASNRCYTDTKGILIRVIYEIICIFVVKNFDDTM